MKQNAKKAADYFFGFPGDSHTYRFGKHCFYASKSKSCVSALRRKHGRDGLCRRAGKIFGFDGRKAD